MVLKDSLAAPLTADEKAFLRKIGHDLSPVVQVGKAGLSPALLAQLRTQFEAHELLKVKVATKAEVGIEDGGAELAAAAGARVVQQIGRVLLLFRPHDDPDDRRIHLPKKRKKKVKSEVSD